MKKILLPTDLSPVSAHALAYALPLAQRLKATVKMLHLTTAVPAEPVVANGKQGPARTAADWAAQQPAMAEYAEVPVTYQEEMGSNPTDMILAACETEKPDLVVMGTRGSGGLRPGALGGVTITVIQGSDVPVLAVPDCAHYKPIKHIAYATDFNNESFNVVKTLIAFAKILDARLTCVHVRGEHEYWDRVKRMYYEHLYSLDQVTPSLDFAILHGENVLHSIQEFNRNNEVDILAMLNRRRDLIDSLYGHSLTREAVLHCRIPLLAFHNQAGT